MVDVNLGPLRQLLCLAWRQIVWKVYYLVVFSHFLLLSLLNAFCLFETNLSTDMVRQDLCRLCARGGGEGGRRGPPGEAFMDHPPPPSFAPPVPVEVELSQSGMRLGSCWLLQNVTSWPHTRTHICTPLHNCPHDQW